MPRLVGGPFERPLILSLISRATHFARIGVLEGWSLEGDASSSRANLARMRAGQAAEIEIDAYGGSKLKGRVASFSPGAGSTFSILPPQNATGNWVKVVQRLPVRIEFDKTPPAMAAAGLSAKGKVDTGPKK